MKISRRSFLKNSAAATMAVSMPVGMAAKVLAAQTPPDLTPGPGNKWPGRVVVNFNKNAITGTQTPVPSVIKTMVDDAIIKLTDETTVAAAWKAVFPSSQTGQLQPLTAQSKIAIKVYCANSAISTHWSSVKAITDGLLQMDFNGDKIPASNIFIYEGNASNQFSAAGFTASNFPAVGGKSIKFEYWPGRTRATDPSNFVDGDDGAFSNRQYAGSLKNADFLINVFSPHGHDSRFANVSLGFKNHYGTYELNVSLSGDLHVSPDSSPNLCKMNCTGPIFNKTVLCVCSGIIGLDEGHGPFGSGDDFSTYSKHMYKESTCTHPTTIIMSTDPISCEMQAIKMLRLNQTDDQGKPNGKYGKDDMPAYLKASAGITGALSGTVYNIGIIDELEMDVRDIRNGVVAIGKHPPVAAGKDPSSIIASPLPGHNSTFINYRLPAGHIGKDASVGIYSINGALVCKRSQKILGALNHFSWDNKDQAGRTVRAGKYAVRVNSGTLALSAHFVVAR